MLGKPGPQGDRAHLPLLTDSASAAVSFKRPRFGTRAPMAGFFRNARNGKGSIGYRRPKRPSINRLARSMAISRSELLPLLSLPSIVTVHFQPPGAPMRTIFISTSRYCIPYQLCRHYDACKSRAKTEARNSRAHANITRGRHVGVAASVMMEVMSRRRHHRKQPAPAAGRDQGLRALGKRPTRCRRP
jgi:hypothetical protein